ncbi:hypothetical protein HanPI659440_Chr02g0090691 [Helianthus annuus]|uniref:Uncharacterized protein n=1 Tax=Helianthus annuus TaxID=4232 RepID=A0A251VIB2_HELAN|nr:hypothetical protein HanPI659440_Chr02g0090691 [Helianthus annuus]
MYLFGFSREMELYRTTFRSIVSPMPTSQRRSRDPRHAPSPVPRILLFRRTNSTVRQRKNS